MTRAPAKPQLKPLHTYTLKFARPSGCPIGVAEEMARFDRGSIIGSTGDPGTDLARGKFGIIHFRTVTITSHYPPTMERWASFAVGTSRMEAVGC